MPNLGAISLSTKGHFVRLYPKFYALFHYLPFMLEFNVLKIGLEFEKLVILGLGFEFNRNRNYDGKIGLEVESKWN